MIDVILCPLFSKATCLKESIEKEKTFFVCLYLVESVFFFLFVESFLQEDFTLGNPNAQRISLKKTFCSKMLKINQGDDFEQKVFFEWYALRVGISQHKILSRKQNFFVLKFCPFLPKKTLKKKKILQNTFFQFF